MVANASVFLFFYEYPVEATLCQSSAGKSLLKDNLLHLLVETIDVGKG